MKIDCERDVEVIRPLAEQWLGKCQARQFGFESTLADILADLNGSLENDGTMLVARGLDNELIGFIVWCAVPNYLNGGRTIAVEKYWYAVPNESMAGPRLFHAAFDLAGRQGCTHFVVSASNMMPDNFQSISRFCLKAGMSPFETQFVRALE